MKVGPGKGVKFSKTPQAGSPICVQYDDGVYSVKFCTNAPYGDVVEI